MRNGNDRERILGPYRPSDREIEELIRRAGRHTGGTEYLVHGAQDAVAATFEVHAFVVDGARKWLAKAGTLAEKLGSR
jgi:hypothetical protein